jgi:glycosyltransferase involved in cell wall biosynthesis
MSVSAVAQASRSGSSAATGSSAGRSPVRLAYLVTHPIQYQAPLLRRIAAEPDIDLTVFYGSDFSLHGYRDEGFGVDVHWDTPLLEGYRSIFLPVLRDKREVSATSPWNRGFLRHLASAPGGGSFDVLWTHGYASLNAMQAMLAAKALGIPVLLRSDSSLSDRNRGGLKLAAKEAFFHGLRSLVDGVLSVGSRNTAYFRHYFGPEFPIFAMPYAVDNDYFQARCREAAATREQIRGELGLATDRPVILFASKLQRRKLCGDLIKAYAQLCTRMPADLLPYLLVVGDGEERAELEAMAAGQGLTDVRFCGFHNQSELPRFFDLCDVFVLPARHEPWGLIVNEVMNAARPVVLSSDVGAHPDLVTNGVEGFVYPVGDIAALADALEHVLASPETSARMGRNALDRIQRWGIDENIDGLRKALQAMTHKLPVRETASQQAPVS